MTKDSKKKVGLLSSVVLILAGFMIFMNFSIEEYVNPVVECRPFQEELQLEVAQAIPGAGSMTTFKHKTQYQQLNDEILTEQLLGKIDESTTFDCLQIPYEAYLNYAKGVCNNILQSGEWNRSIMAEVRNNCKMLVESPYCKHSESDVLNHNITIVNKYYEALDVIEISHSYSSIDNVRSLSQQAEKFRSNDDLKVCVSLMSELDSVPSNLYHAHVAHVRDVINSSSSVIGYAAVDELKNVAEIYGKTLNNVTSDLSEEIKALELRFKKEVEKANESKFRDVDDNNF
ncbi:MAG: hypothetical protein K6E73_00065 [Bacteroidales bacterium]|nr:hypothetical protein [Bacteroidales bacterium]